MLAGVDRLSLITSLRLLIEEENVFLASPEDASFFRKLYEPPAKKSVPLPPKPLPKISLPLPKKEESPPIEKLPEPTEKAPAPLSHSPPKPSSFLRSLLQKIAPEIPILPAPPDDTLARKKATGWKTKNQIAPLSILFFAEPPEQKRFLEAIAKALDVYFGPAHLIGAEPIEKENQWETFLSAKELKWVLLCDSSLWQLPRLLRFYKENGPSGSRSLKETPLFLLPDLSLYLKDPLLKRSLWKALCQKLAM